MGMFDTIQVNIQLPGHSYITDEKFQTKSFECLLDNYIISDNRQIYREVWNYEWVDSDEKHLPLQKYLKKVEGTYRREYLTDLHGDIIFYSNKPIDEARYDYFARFSYGTLDRIWIKEWDKW